MQQRVENWIALGRKIGSSTGWDGNSRNFYQIYDFIPYPNVDLPTCKCLGINYEDGIFYGYNDSGEIVWERDMLDVLRFIPKHEPEITES
jgi:hypothetical protein